MSDVDLDYIDKLSHGYVEVIAGANEDDIDEVAEPIVAHDYTRCKVRISPVSMQCRPRYRTHALWGYI